MVGYVRKLGGKTTPKALQLFPLSTGQSSGFLSLTFKVTLCEKVTSLVTPFSIFTSYSTCLTHAIAPHHSA